MGKKKTPFINKKTASTYHLIHRSQRDVGGDYLAAGASDAGAAAGGQQADDSRVGNNDGANTKNNASSSNDAVDMILWPSPGNDPRIDQAVLFGPKKDGADGGDDDKSNTRNETNSTAYSANNQRVDSMNEWRAKLSRAGLLDVDHERYLKPMTSGGVYIDAATGKRCEIVDGSTARSTDNTGKGGGGGEQQQHQHEDENLAEHAIMEIDGRRFDAITLTTDCMDDEIAAVLFGDTDELFGEGGGGGGGDGDGGSNNGTGPLEELNDEFIFQAAGVGEDGNNTANGERDVDDDDPYYSEAAAFDYDRHIAALLEKARQEDAGGGMAADDQQDGQRHAWGQQDAAFFANARALRDDAIDVDEEEYDDEFEDGGRPTAAPTLTTEEERVLCEKFHETLAEYDDDDDSGDYEEEGCDDAGVDYYAGFDFEAQQHHQQQQDEGHDDNGDDGEDGNENGSDDGGLLREVDDPQISAMMDDYLAEKDDGIFMQGAAKGQDRENANSNNKKKNNPGSGFSVLSSVPPPPAGEAEPTVDEVLRDAKTTLARQPAHPPPEEILIDGQSYFSERIRNPWDCESILTMYSNIDNNPIMIDGSSSGGRRSRRSRGKDKQKIAPLHEEEEQYNDGRQPEEHYERIQLSDKTGLPIGVLPSAAGNNAPNDNEVDYCFADGTTSTVMSVNRGVARNKRETPEEKKIRKQMIKQQRQIARMEKKVTKEIYKEEFLKHAVVSTADAVDVGNGKSVFRYS